jgi:transglutaminase-like putative cysteine protease
LKRRNFLAASALLSLLAPTSVLAAKKSKTSAKATRRSSTKKSSRQSAPAAAEKPEAPAAASSPQPGAEQPDATGLPDEPATPWRIYDITSTIALKEVKGKLRLWLPLALHKDTLWQRSLGQSWQGNFTNAGIYRDPAETMVVFYADWNEGVDAPQLQITSQVAKRDRHFDITRRGNAAERSEVLRQNLHASNLVPTDGLVRRTAERAVGRIQDPLARGKAIYDWVLENTTYDPSLPGSGRGDIEAMLDSGQLSGKSADITLLFVGLCRAIGIPARPFFGQRIDSSRLFSGLGATGNLSTEQQCRAEFYTPGYGWIPVNPADVRKAIHDEHLSSNDPKLVVLSKLLFGFWEMNWVAFNSALDVRLRGGNGKALPFLVLPQAEVAANRFDSLDTKRFSYTVHASSVEG